MSENNWIAHRVFEVTLNGHRYFLELAKGWVYLTRCLSECIGCPHYELEDCNEFSSDYIFTCDREDPDVPNCYDFNAHITTEEYPEFTAEEIAYINSLVDEAKEDN